jgi:hypothetical protein
LTRPGKPVDTSAKPMPGGPIEYLDPDQAVAAIGHAGKGQRWRKGNHRWTVTPTPTSTRREQAEREAQQRVQDRAGPGHGAQRRAGVASPRPALAAPSPEELAKVYHEAQERSRAGLLLTAEEVQAHKRYNDGHHPIQAHIPGRR